jgi:hypothetical protein
MLTLHHIHRQAAGGRFLVAVAHVDAGLAHGFDAVVQRHEVLAVAAKRQRCGGDGFHRSKGIAFDAGNLHQSAHRITRHAQMMLKGDFGGVFHLLIGAAQGRAKTVTPIIGTGSSESPSLWPDLKPDYAS